MSAFFSTGVTLGGGIASVCRSLGSAVSDDEAFRGAGTLRVYGLHDPRGRRQATQYSLRGCGGSGTRMVGGILYEYMKPGSRLVFGHIALARVAGLLPWVRPYSVWVYGLELDGLAGDRAVVRSLRRAERVFAISEWTRDRLLEEIPELAGRTRIVYPCIERARELVWSEQEGEAAGEGPELDPTAIIVGRMPANQPGKGHETLIRMWPWVRDKVPGAQLLVVGEGDDKERLQSLVEGGNVRGIRFLGAVDDRELGMLYRRSHVFVMPSHQDGFGIVYAEAMWHGLPCVGSETGGARAVVTDQQTGLLVDPESESGVADTVARLLGGGILYSEMSRRARAHARSYFTFDRFRADVERTLDDE